MNKTTKSALEQFKIKKYHNIYFLQGDNEYEIDLITKYIDNNILTDKEKTFDFLTIFGNEVKITQIVQYANRIPMVAAKQVIIVKEAQDIQDINKETGKNMFIKYINSPNPKTILVLAYKNKTIDKRSALGKALINNTCFISTKKLYDNQVTEWIFGYIKNKGYSVTPKAVSMLLETVGNNQNLISKEIDKILINLDPSNIISDSIVQNYVGISKDFNIFELQKAIIEKNFNKIFFIYKFFEANPKSIPLMPIVSFLTSFFIKVIQIHYMKDKSKKNIAFAINTNYYFVNDYITAHRNYSLKQSINCLEQLHETDLKIKNINNPVTKESQILKELLINICR